VIEFIKVSSEMLDLLLGAMRCLLLVSPL
jgi:hypothetical protein